MFEDELKVKLDEETAEIVHQAIYRRIQDAVMGASDRDELLVEYDDQIEGLSNPTAPPRWSDACELDAPITREAVLTVWTQIVATIKREPKVSVEAADPDDDDNASAQEALLANKGAEIGLDKALAAIAYYAIKYPVGIAYCDWTEKVKNERYKLYRDGDKFVDAHERDPAKVYKEQWFTMPVVDYAGPEVRAVPTSDFYLYPATARCICDANWSGSTADMIAASSK